METHVFRVDPLDPKLGMHFFTPILQRVKNFADDSFTEVEADVFTREIAARACGDDDLLLLGVITDKGLLIGHSLATLQEEGGKRWVYGMQIWLDKGYNAPEAAGDLLATTEEWGKQKDAKELLFLTRRSDLAWIKKYGFKTDRSVMEKALVPEKDGERGWGSTKDVPKA